MLLLMSVWLLDDSRYAYAAHSHRDLYRVQEVMIGSSRCSSANDGLFFLGASAQGFSATG